MQLRSAICVDPNERQVRDENCARQEKHLKRSCNQEACPKWDLGEWGSVRYALYRTRYMKCDILISDINSFKILCYIENKRIDLYLKIFLLISILSDNEILIRHVL